MIENTIIKAFLRQIDIMLEDGGISDITHKVLKSYIEAAYNEWRTDLIKKLNKKHVKNNKK